MKVLLISTYELGRQPFGIASPAAWLRREGHAVTCADLSINPLPSLAAREAELIAFYVPMHTATRLALEALRRIRPLGLNAHLCAYGLYAPLNEELLRQAGVQTILGGEVEGALARLALRLGRRESAPNEPTIVLDRLDFIPPDRSGLPPLQRYARLHINGSTVNVGYTEASRGCKHLCRHCPVVPVYQGAFRVVQPEVVLEDARAQVAAGAGHITFGDPDFLNGPAHARRIVEAFHAEFPRVTYDVTVKIEHLRKHPEFIAILRDTGCLFVTTAVESVDGRVLAKLDKGHTRADFIEVVEACRAAGLTLAPTFIPFTPWTTRASYCDLLSTVAALGLIDAVGTVQLALRLLITSRSRLLELEDIRHFVGSFDPVSMVHTWRHPDPRMDELASAVMAVANWARRERASRRDAFRSIWELAHGRPPAEDFDLLPRAVIPYMDEPWFC